MVSVSDQDMNTHLAEVSRVRSAAVTLLAIQMTLLFLLQCFLLEGFSDMDTPVVTMVADFRFIDFLV